ncbi:hypothetical protein ONE63_010094 [Megalurothrips usitatus]|uniref:Uncharacterized protein n=1 Tax=Megalurothrips usitatus TaxID=439358 RepID=A0AAV7XGR5_9NEOP|nr:hypothetical protein ONE63_010094 [Megalurothrips usitatus]
MKAAKDGQDNQDCTLVYATCTQSDAASPMAHTFQDINKLVQARRMARMSAGDHAAEERLASTAGHQSQSGGPSQAAVVMKKGVADPHAAAAA